MDHLGVSRETLREAMRILESQSLVEVRRGRGGGAIVRRPGLEAVGRYVALVLQLRGTTLADLEQARCVVEPPAAADVAARGSVDDLAVLVRLHDAERAATADPLAFTAAVSAFDRAVLEASGCQTVAVLAGVLGDLYAGQVFAASDDADRSAAARLAGRVVAGHGAFLDAVRRQDARLGATAWGDYLVTTARLLVPRRRSRRAMDVAPLWRAQAAVGRPRRAVAVAAEVRARIADGELRDGDRLAPLPDLAAEFGVSRPTLREALRILETEHLLDLRAGDRGGATIRAPSTQVAARLAGIVLEARHVTLGDFHRALRMVEPPIVEALAGATGPRSVAALRKADLALSGAVDDTGRFVRAWSEAETVLFGLTRNPALTVIAEILHWVRDGVVAAVTNEVDGRDGVVGSNRRAHRRFSAVVAAVERRDPIAARRGWADLLEANAPFAEGSDLGSRLVVDLIE